VKDIRKMIGKMIGMREKKQHICKRNNEPAERGLREEKRARLRKHL
jgi:hypothetical protein